MEIWECKVKTGGIISGHDYNHGNFPDVKKVIDAWVSEKNYELNIEKGYVHIYSDPNIKLSLRSLIISMYLPQNSSNDTSKGSSFRFNLLRILFSLFKLSILILFGNIFKI